MKTEDFDLPYSKWESFINEWILDKKEREMVKRHILDGETYPEIAEEFNYSVQHTFKKVHAAEEYLFKHIK